MVLKTVTKEKCKKALSEEALQILRKGDKQKIRRKGNWHWTVSTVRLSPEEALQILRKGDKQKIRRKGKIYPSECIVPKNRKEREESLLW